MIDLSNRVQLLKGDITMIAADAIVNAANNSLMGGGGVDGAIHRAGGKQILEECKRIVAKQGGCETGKAVITTAGMLPAKYVIHTVGPVWHGGNNNERDQLAACYRNSLLLAAQHDCKIISFPNISTGVYRFPKDEAAKLSVKAVAGFLLLNEIPGKVLFVCFDEENYFWVEKYMESGLSVK